MRIAASGETMSLPDTTEQNHHKRFVLGRGLNIMGTTKTQLIVVEPEDTIDGIISNRNRTFRPILRGIEAEGFRCSIKSADRRIDPVASMFPRHIGQRKFQPICSGLEQGEIAFARLVGREDSDDFPIAQTDVVDLCACHVRFRLTEAKSMQKRGHDLFLDTSTGFGKPTSSIKQKPRPYAGATLLSIDDVLPLLYKIAKFRGSIATKYVLYLFKLQKIQKITFDIVISD